MYDDLFGHRRGGPGANWLETMSDECRAWVEGLADSIVEKGTEPKSWKEVHRTVEELFPADAPSAASTVTKYVRHLVAKRG